MSESRIKNSIKNIAWSYLTIFVNIVLHFIRRTVFVRYLGIELLGINGLFSNIISVLSLVDLGFATAIAYSYYEPIAKGDTKRLSALVSFYKKIYNCIAICMALIGLCVLPFLTLIVRLESPIDHLEIYYLLALCETVASYLIVYKSVLVNAFQKNFVVSKLTIVSNVIVVVLQIFIIIILQNYVLFCIASILGIILTNTIVSVFADRTFPFIKEKSYQLSKNEKKNIFKNISSVFVYKVSGVMINSTDNILISSIVGTVFVGYYSNYLIIINNMVNLVSKTFSSITASVGNLIHEKDNLKKESIFNSSQVISFWFSTVLSSCVFALVNEFVEIWLGKEYCLSMPTVSAIAINLFLTCSLQSIWTFREAAGIYRKTKYVMLVTAILNIGLSIWWGIRFGIAGILFASAASKVLTYIWYEPLVLFDTIFSSKPWRYYVKLLINFFLTVGLALLLWETNRLLPFNGWGGIVLKGMISFAIANAIYFLIYGKQLALGSWIVKIRTVMKK